MFEPLSSLYIYEGDRIRAGRHDITENKLVSLIEAGPDPISAPQFNALQAIRDADIPPAPDTGLRDWINAVSVYPGQSVIYVVTYRAPVDAPAVLRTTVTVRTLFDQLNNNSWQLPQRYEFARTTTVFDTADGLYHWPFRWRDALHATNIDNIGTQWSKDLKRAILGVPERTLRNRFINFESSMNENGANFRTLKGQYPFRKERQPDYAAVLPNVLTKIRPDQGNSTSCPICYDDFAWNNDEEPSFTCPPGTRFAMALRYCKTPTSPRHVVCMPCLLDICNNSGIKPRELSCPLCKALLFKDKDDLRDTSDLNHLVYSVQRNPHPAAGLENHPNEQYIFCNDPRYAAWENALRSCSDLDAHLSTSEALDDAGNPIKDYQVAVENPDMIIDIWLDMVALDDTYPDDAAHQVTQMAEWSAILQEVASFWRETKDWSDDLSADGLFAAIKWHLTTVLVNYIERGPRAKVLLCTYLCLGTRSKPHGSRPILACLEMWDGRVVG